MLQAPEMASTIMLINDLPDGLDEAGLRERRPPLAREKGIERLLQTVQMQHIGGGIVELGGRELCGAPVGLLLLLGDVDTQQIAQEILQTVAVREGPGELGGDLGAVDRGCQHAEGVIEHGDVEAAEMEELEHAGIGEHPAEIGGLALAGGNLDEMAVPVPRRHLHEAEPVAAGHEAHRLAVDRHGGPQIEPLGQIAPVASNDTPLGRQRNRRVEVWLRPAEAPPRAAAP